MTDWWERAGYTEQEATLLQKWLLDLEQGYRAPHRIRKKSPTSDRLNRVRFAARKRRQLLKSLQRPLPRNLPKELLIAKFKRNDALDALNPRRLTRWLPVLSRTRFINIDLSGFSFLENPIGTMEAFCAISNAEMEGLNVRVNFKDPNCLDVGAMLLLQEIWPHLCPVFTGGDIEPMVAQMLEAVGLRRVMGWKPIPASERNADIFPFPFRRQSRSGGKTSQGVEPQLSSIVATQVVKFIDQSLLQTSRVRLTRKARQNFHGLIGEILDNAGAHSSPDQKGGYSICGFLERRETSNGDIFRFNLSFLSMGQTIADGLANAPAVIAKGMNEYVTAHKGVSGLTEENLRTVYALRDGVTRLSEKLNVVGNRSLGGTGLADILDFFAGLALFADPKDTPRLAIVSGNTYLQASGTYSRAIRFTPPGMTEVSAVVPRELWFNQANAKSQPPDVGHVYSLPGRLQGTLVTLGFNLDPHLVEKLKDAKNGSNDDKG
ncbi:hypothetical protein ACK83U_00710 [Rhizobium sp. WW22]|uniref:hypothetical protein n=1 Tax=Rhizobium sp. WW22 TaxID=3389070 RepID=UPI00399B8483